MMKSILIRDTTGRNGSGSFTRCSGALAELTVNSVPAVTTGRRENAMELPHKDAD